jgi:uncharacterized protein (DUF342 family)
VVSLDQIQSYMRHQLEEDSEGKSVSVSGESLEDALQQAAVELSLPIKKIEYEIIERGTRGMLGVGRKPYQILAYAARTPIPEAVAGEEVSIALSLRASEEQEQDLDGQVFVRMDADGVMLKVTPPVGKGRKATEREAMERLLERTDDNLDKSRIAKVVRAADGEFVRVGDFDHDPSADASLTVEITESEMKAYMLAYPPGEGGADPSFEQVVAFLQTNGVVTGIDEDAVRRFEDDPAYRESILVANGTPPRDGANARVSYSFETNPGHVTLKETNGRVDFRELNLVQNVVEGQMLAKKIPAEHGEPGQTVTGKLLPADDGKDLDIPVGKNVRLSDDGMTALAEVNGQVVITAGKIVVEPVHVITGDVNLRTGNILFLGTVLVKGNVDDGFTVKAAGNIEVMGSVGKSTLDAEGDIIVHQGIAGKTAGLIRCGKSVWAKFIENARVEAGDLVVVSDGIISSTVLADRRIICKGRRASIVGGQLKAVEEINAKSLGSVAGSETILEVGYDPKRKEKLSKLEERKQELRNELSDVKLNMSTIESFVKAGRKIPSEKKKYYQELKEKRIDLEAEIKELEAEAGEISEYLSELKVSGRISASGTVFPGVKISIKDAFLEVRNEFKAVTFIADNHTVKVTRYEETDEDVSVGRRG